MKINNKLIFYFSLLISITFIASMYLLFKDSEELASLEVAMMEHPEATKIWVCGKEIKDIGGIPLVEVGRKSKRSSALPNHNLTEARWNPIKATLVIKEIV